MVEVLALAPVLAACTLGFAAGAAQLVAMARAEAALANAVAADAAGTSIHGAVHRRARIVSVTPGSIEIAVEAPLGEVRLSGRRVP